MWTIYWIQWFVKVLEMAQETTQQHGPKSHSEEKDLQHLIGLKHKRQSNSSHWKSRWASENYSKKQEKYDQGLKRSELSNFVKVGKSNLWNKMMIRTYKKTFNIFIIKLHFYDYKNIILCYFLDTKEPGPFAKTLPKDKPSNRIPFHKLKSKNKLELIMIYCKILRRFCNNSIHPILKNCTYFDTFKNLRCFRKRIISEKENKNWNEYLGIEKDNFWGNCLVY